MGRERRRLPNKRRTPVHFAERGEAGKVEEGVVVVVVVVVDDDVYCSLSEQTELALCAL